MAGGWWVCKYYSVKFFLVAFFRHKEMTSACRVFYMQFPHSVIMTRHQNMSCDYSRTECIDGLPPFVTTNSSCFLRKYLSRWLGKATLTAPTESGDTKQMFPVDIETHRRYQRLYRVKLIKFDLLWNRNFKRKQRKKLSLLNTLCNCNLFVKSNKLGKLQLWMVMVTGNLLSTLFLPIVRQ